MTKLSIVISALNEEKKIEDCLKSAEFADEIIVIDNTSSDETVSIARKYTSKIYIKPNNLMLNANKNFGFSKATGSWIYSLDADERITKELAKEIKETISRKPQDISGYWVSRKNIIFGKWIRHTGWYPDYQLRLFRKNKGKFEEKHVHEMIKLEGKSEYLKNSMMHYNFDDIAHFLQKTFIIYAPNEAENLLKNGYQYDWRDAIKFPTKEFLSRFFAREGYKDGIHGLILSLLMAFYHFVVFANIWQAKNFFEAETTDFIEETGNELTRTHKEILFWLKQEKIKNIKNPIKKSIYRLIKK